MNDKNLIPSEEDQQWLKELFESASAEPVPEEEDVVLSSKEEEQWLNELFASAELVPPQEPAPTESVPLPTEQDPLASDFLETTPGKPEPLTMVPLDLEEEVPDSMPVLETAADPSFDYDPLLDPELEALLGLNYIDGEESMESGGDEPTEETPEDPAEEAEEESPEESKEEAEEETGVETGEASDEEEAVDDREPSKRRPRNKDGFTLFGLPHLLVTAVWLAIVVTFGIFLGQWLWRGASDVLAFDREEKQVTITITASDDLDSLVDKLHSAGLIQEPAWFRLYGQLTNVMEDIDPGTFELSTLFDYHALVSHMSAHSAVRVTVKVFIPEGYSCAQIFNLLEEKGVCSAAGLEAASINGNFNDYWFLEGVSRESKYCLEGYLFPDTYEFYVGDDPERVLNKLLSTFDSRFTEIMLEKLDTLNDTLAKMMRANGLSESYIQSHQYTIREVVIIASLIEKETANAAEGYTVSSVIYNRLTNPENHPYLNIDAALVYATGNSSLTEVDKQFDSPYNTYLYPGLIPGPICNPSRASLDAALDPADTRYYYYALDPRINAHHFSKTYAEHLAFLNSLPEEETP